MKKRRTSAPSSGVIRSSLTARTGHHCPSNGFWQPEEGAAEPAFIFEGSVMPSSGGKSTLWLLVDPVTSLAGPSGANSVDPGSGHLPSASQNE